MSSSAQADKELVEKVKKGDKKAFDLLVLKYQQKVANIISRYIHDHSEVLDVSQEIATNTAKNHLAAKGRRPPMDDVEAMTAEQMDSGMRLKEYATPENLAMEEEVAITIRQAVDDLPEDLRMAITLRELEGLSYEEIAQAMDCPIGTVRSRIFRARDAIDKKLKPLLN